MNGNMKTIKKELRKKINKVTAFDEFDTILKNLSSDVKGLYFEIFYKIYFLIFPYYKMQYPIVYLYVEIPEKVKNRLNLPDKDKGIDGIAITSTKEYYAVQVKYRKTKRPIPFGELATFPALAFGTNCKYISGGIFFTNCYDVCDELKGEKYKNITYSCFDKCNNDFWNNFRDYLSSEIVTDFIPYTPLPHQEKILPIIKRHFEENDYGRLYLPCGCGKSLMGVFTAIDILKLTKIFIVVPSLYLLSETYETWIKQLYKDNKFKFLLIGSDIDKKEDLLCEYNLTTNIEDIEQFINNNKDNIVVITTYQSSQLFKDACKNTKFKFDIGIFDEAHRTVGTTEKKFTTLLSNKRICKKRLFMTATEKVYHYQMSKLSKEQQENILSMDKEDIYGKVIHNYSTRQAIEDNQLVDYKVIAPFISTDKYDKLLENNSYVQIENTTYEIKLLALAIMIIEVVKENDIHHLLIFSNKNEKAKRILEIIDQLLEKEELKIFTKYLNGSDNMNKRKYQVKLFEQSERGIISSARIFGEGVNIPICDAVCFADNKGSTVDIIQYVGRCLRKCTTKPNKISCVIVPFILDVENEIDFFDNDSTSFFKLRRILKSLGTTDDMVSEKFVLKNCNKLSSNKGENKESVSQMILGQKLNIKEFKQHIISKIFDRDGDPESRIRSKIIYENKRRLLNKQELIDTKKKCLKFLKDECEDKTPKTKNWIKFCIGTDLFLEMKKKYYYNKDELKEAFVKLKINDFDDYKIKYTNDDRLPHPDYINDGFYYDLDERFDIMSLIEENNDDYDY